MALDDVVDEVEGMPAEVGDVEAQARRVDGELPGGRRGGRKRAEGAGFALTTALAPSRIAEREPPGAGAKGWRPGSHLAGSIQVQRPTAQLTGVAGRRVRGSCATPTGPTGRVALKAAAPSHERIEARRLPDAPAEVLGYRRVGPGQHALLFGQLGRREPNVEPLFVVLKLWRTSGRAYGMAPTRHWRTACRGRTATCP